MEMGVRRAMCRRGIIVFCVSRLMKLRPVGTLRESQFQLKVRVTFLRVRAVQGAEELAPERVCSPSVELHSRARKTTCQKSCDGDRDSNME